VVPQNTSAATNDLSLRTLTSEWDVREVLDAIMGEPFDERVDADGNKLLTGLPVFVWWPDVSPEPTIRSAIDGWESVGWGFAQLTLRGATSERVLRSAWEHPTGSELRQPKFGGAGPWRDVDWSLLRKRVADVKRLIAGPLGGIAPADGSGWVLPAATAEANAGRRSLS
jgi:hypothetical protein